MSRLTVFAALATVLAAFAMTPVVAAERWFPGALVAVALIGAAGWLTRRHAAPPTAVLGIQVAVLVLYLTSWYGQGAALAGIIPGPETLDRFRALFAAGLHDIRRYAAPVPSADGIDFIMVATLGLVAILVDTIAVTLRQAPLAGLPLLAVYSVATFVPHDGSTEWLFALGAIGYVALLLADGQERLSRWGRPLVTAEGAGGAFAVSTQPAARVGRRIGVAAVAAAVFLPTFLPTLLPGLNEGLLERGGTGTGEGSGVITTVNPLVDIKSNLLQTSDVPMLTVSTDNPDAQNQYIQLVALDVFRGDVWAYSRPPLEQLRGELPEPEGLDGSVRRTKVRTVIEVEPGFATKWLPTPYPPRRVDIEGRWLYDPDGRYIIGDRPASGLTYTVESLHVQPTPEQLARAPRAGSQMDRYRELPADLPQQVRVLADQVTRGAPNLYAKALKLQSWFIEEFAYTLDPQPGNGNTAIERFLDSRQGYCEQFAATFAVMARHLGIPARVVVGFTPGTPQPDGRYLITAHDAHAWPELYFEGVGWVRFEPTPNATGGNANIPPWTWESPQDSGEPAPGASAAAPGTPPSAGPDTGADGVDQREKDLGTVGGQAEASPLAALWRVLRWALLGLLVAVAALTPMLLRLVVSRQRRRTARRLRRQGGRPRRPVPAALRFLTRGLAPVGDPIPQQAIALLAWAELRDVARDLGYGWNPAETPRQAAARLARAAALTEEPRAALRRLALTYERVRYARDPGQVGDLFTQVAQARVGLAAPLGRRARVRARLLPRSVGDLVSWLGERIADGLDWADGLGPRLRRWILVRAGQTHRG
ncbi:Transglutaminase domain-containing protein [Carbonactinospora thermoautotrophica]|uniref:Transglutaminase domain-containing protein n=2 Tax=Carbonactinospora thermoautotrophica TaxID=1469144 RepID=A0A132MUS1_9ACTN|nr:DUF3488 and transglutaminase-like domain-containing protein [Carbonactinospora thermoautotrophica]KWX01601.1 Transglutaminase domain-containing protein [Carbonactinospora thermoautotrophica]